MPFHNPLDDGQSQAETTGLGFVFVVQADEGLKYPRALIRRYAGAIIFYGHFEGSIGHSQLDDNFLPRKTRGILQKIKYHTLHQFPFTVEWFAGGLVL